MKRLTIIGSMETMVAWNDAIPNREEFRTSTGNLRGVDEWLGRGRLPKEWAEKMPEAAYFNGGRKSYFVYSYATPIAWWDERTGEWTVPDEKYSTTTTRHQGQVRMALHRAGLTYRESV